MNKILIFLSVSIFLGACTDKSPQINIADTLTSDAINAYPPVIHQTDSLDSYPLPEEDAWINIYPEAIDIPMPSSSTSTVTGFLLTSGTNEPYLGVELFLGLVEQADQPGYPPLVSYSVESSPKAVLARNGLFVFSDVPPGEYGLVLYTPIAVNLMLDSEESNFLLITVVAGRITDLGKIFVK